MAESELHHRMKEGASEALAAEGYRVFFEPRFAPSRFLTWEAYRPDVFGVKSAAGRQEYAMVECETNPSTRKLVAKNFTSVDVQTRLNADFALRRILVVPRGRLRSLDPSVRLAWETWIYDGLGFQRLPRASSGNH
jgi:hypothetical protein